MRTPRRQKNRLMNRIARLKSRGVSFSQKFLNECQCYDLSRDHARRFSISSTLSFVEKLLETSLCYDIEVENRADVQAFLNGRFIIFEIKSLYSFVADYFKTVSKWTQRFYNDVLNKYGLFAKVLFLLSYKYGLQPYILEYRKVSTTHNASFGVLYFSLDALHQWTVPRIKSSLRHSYGQLKKATAKYRIAVVDMRYEGINEFKAYHYILKILRRKKYEKLSGVILMTFGIKGKNTIGPKLILIPNPYAENTIMGSTLFKDFKQPLSYGRRYLLELPIRIRFKKTGWQNCLNIEPGYRIVHKGKEYGTL